MQVAKIYGEHIFSRFEIELYPRFSKRNCILKMKNSSTTRIGQIIKKMLYSKCIFENEPKYF